MFGLFKRRAPSGNDQVRQALAKYGDDGRQPRHVIYFAWPEPDASSPGDKTNAMEIIRGFGEFEFTTEEGRPGLKFENHREVASREFDTMTDAMKADLARIGWTFDGWECAVAEGKGKS